jgi:hypothetical protein
MGASREGGRERAGDGGVDLESRSVEVGFLLESLGEIWA